MAKPLTLLGAMKNSKYTHQFDAYLKNNRLNKATLKANATSLSELNLPVENLNKGNITKWDVSWLGKEVNYSLKDLARKDAVLTVLNDFERASSYYEEKFGSQPVYLHYEENTYSEYREPEQFGSWESHQNTEIVGVTLEENGVAYLRNGALIDVENFSVPLKTDEGEVKAGTPVYVVVVNYSSGNTFGRSYGHKAFVDVLINRKEAEQLANYISEHTSRFDYAHVSKYVGYTSWLGYFEIVDYVDVEVFELR